MQENKQFAKLCEIMDTLLGENGCPWDRSQTHQSLRPHLLEESYEVADAIDNGDMTALQEELGDLLLQVILHSRIAEKEKHFSLSDVIGDVSKKLVQRHTHIFQQSSGTAVASDNSGSAMTPKDVEKIWEENKNKEKSINTPLENMEAVPKALPALARAQKVVKRSERDFSCEDLLSEIRHLLDESSQFAESYPHEESQQENMEKYGNILFHLAALLTKMQINAEFSLTNATFTFINSFK